MSIVDEYREDLKSLRRQHAKISKQNKTITYKVLGEERQRKEDLRSAIDKRDQRIVAEMISSTEYALFWLENGYEQPYDKPSSSLPKYLRDQLWGDIDECIKWRGIKSSRELMFEDWERSSEKDSEKQLQLEQVNEIVSTFSSREKELFELKYAAMLSDQECAAKMDLAKGTIKSMSQRIRDKIDRYFEYGHQISLF